MRGRTLYALVLCVVVPSGTLSSPLPGPVRAVCPGPAEDTIAVVEGGWGVSVVDVLNGCVESTTGITGVTADEESRQEAIIEEDALWQEGMVISSLRDCSSIWVKSRRAIARFDRSGGGIETRWIRRLFLPQVVFSTSSALATVAYAGGLDVIDTKTGTTARTLAHGPSPPSTYWAKIGAFIFQDDRLFLRGFADQGGRGEFGGDRISGKVGVISASEAVLAVTTRQALLIFDESLRRRASHSGRFHGLIAGRELTYVLEGNEIQARSNSYNNAVVWKRSVGPRSRLLLAITDLLLVLTRSPVKEEYVLSALHAEDGHVVWTYAGRSEIGFGSRVWSQVARRVLVHTTGELISIDLVNGRALWSYDRRRCTE